MHRTRIWILHACFLVFTIISFRHFFETGDHLWTGEGARLSWSMRLKGKVCDFGIKINEGEWHAPDFRSLSFTQHTNQDDPYFFLQYVKKTQCDQGNRVYANIVCRAVSHLPAPLIRPDADLCKVEYNFFSHNDWIYPYPGLMDPKYREWFDSSKRVQKK